MSESDPNRNLSPRNSFRTSVSSMFSGLVRSFSFNDSENDTSSANTSNHHHGGGTSAATSFELPPLEPIALKGFSKDSFSQPQDRLMSSVVAEEIRTLLPERLKLVSEWNLIYGLLQDGASLHTMYSHAKKYRDTRAGFVLVLQDSSRGIFGAYLSEYPHPSPAYFGSGECFLWRATTISDSDLKHPSLPPPPSADTVDIPSRSTTLTVASSTASSTSSPDGAETAGLSTAAAKPKKPPTRLRFKAFPWSGLNDFFMNCDKDFFSIGGGGGHYGLRIDTSIEHGHSARCETFGNEPLSKQGEKFYIVNAELWAIGA